MPQLSSSDRNPPSKLMMLANILSLATPHGCTESDNPSVNASSNDSTGPVATVTPHSEPHSMSSCNNDAQEKTFATSEQLDSVILDCIPRKGVMKKKHLQRKQMKERLLVQIPPMDKKNLQVEMKKNSSTPASNDPPTKKQNDEPTKSENNIDPTFGSSPQTPENEKKRALFPEKLHHLLCRDDTDATIISWAPNGKYFIIHDANRFTEEIMSQIFNHTSFASFQRQLNLYGFKRTARASGRDERGYFHKSFLRSQPELCLQMRRNKMKGGQVKQAKMAQQGQDDYPEETAFQETTGKVCHTSPMDMEESAPLRKKVPKAGKFRIIGRNNAVQQAPPENVQTNTSDQETLVRIIDSHKANTVKKIDRPVQRSNNTPAPHKLNELLSSPISVHDGPVSIQRQREAIENALLQKMMELQSLIQPSLQQNIPLSQDTAAELLASQCAKEQTKTSPNLNVTADQKAYLQQLIQDESMLQARNQIGRAMAAGRTIESLRDEIMHFSNKKATNNYPGQLTSSEKMLSDVAMAMYQR